MAQPSLPSYDSTRNNFLILPILHLPVIELIYKSQAQFADETTATMQDDYWISINILLGDVSERQWYVSQHRPALDEILAL